MVIFGLILLCLCLVAALVLLEAMALKYEKRFVVLVNMLYGVGVIALIVVVAGLVL